MSGANGMPRKPADELKAFERRIAAYVERAEEAAWRRRSRPPRRMS